MVHLYLIGVFSIIFHVIIFFASIIALTGIYDDLIVGVSTSFVIIIILSSVFSILSISNTLKISHINHRKTKKDILDTDIEEEKKKYHFIKPFNIPIIITVLICYLIVLWQLIPFVNSNEIENLSFNPRVQNTSTIRAFFITGVYVVSWYYFIQVLRLNKLIKKYGIIKNNS